MHHEIELALVIGDVCKQVQESAVQRYIHAYALAIDLTARDLQAAFKQRGHPWELAKSFDDSCPISCCVAAERVQDAQDLELRLLVNDELRQEGNTKQMIHPINKLIAFISQYVTLLPGDLVLTGTPAGVSQIHAGDRITCQLADLITQSTTVV